MAVERVLATQSDLIEKLRREAGAGPSAWDARYRQILFRYAAHVHLLPASQNHHHYGAGGLLRHGFEAAFFSLRVAGEKVVGLELPPQERKGYTERFRFCAFAAGLLHDVAKPVTDMVVTSAAGAVWNPLETDLVSWAETNQVERYFIRWRPGRVDRHEAVGGLLLLKMLGRPASAWLNAGGSEWLIDLAEAISGHGAAGNLLSEIAGEGDRQSVAQDIAQRPTDVEPVELPVVRWILDTMRTLMREDRGWRIGGGVVYPVEDAIALVWPRAGADLASRLHKSGVVGVPYDPDSMADILLDQGIAEPASEENGRRVRYWMLERESNGAIARQKVLRIVRPEVLVDPPPAALPGRLYGPSDRGLAPAYKMGKRAVDEAQAADDGCTEEGDRGKNAKKNETPGENKTLNATPPGEPETGGKAEENQYVDEAPACETTNGAAQQLIQAVFEDVRAGRAPPGTIIRDVHAVYIRYPEGVRGYGYGPLDAAKLLAEAGLVERPDSTKLVSTLSNGRGLKLSEDADRLLRVREADIPNVLSQWFAANKTDRRIERGGKTYLPREELEQWIQAVAPDQTIASLLAKGEILAGKIGGVDYARLKGDERAEK